MDTAYLNGEYLPLAQANVSVLDRGLLFADAVYEVIPVYAGHAFLLDAHLQRLDNSLAGIRLANPYSAAQWRGMLKQLIQVNGAGDMAVYLQVTRGTAPRRDHKLPEHPKPTIIAFCQSRVAPAPGIFSNGVMAVTQQDTRWARCEIKSTSLLANILAFDDACAEGAGEAILLREGLVMEGASSNIFLVKNGALQTPALRPEILPGITRALLLQLAKEAGIACTETDISESMLSDADEIWLSSSTREIFPVTQLNGQAVGKGKPGPVWAQMRQLIHGKSHG